MTFEETILDFMSRIRVFPSKTDMARVNIEFLSPDEGDIGFNIIGKGNDVVDVLSVLYKIAVAYSFEKTGKKGYPKIDFLKGI